jgi:FdhD protein
MEVNRTTEVPVCRIVEGEFVREKDRLTIEEPLEIRLVYGLPEDRRKKRIAVTMRTPGEDKELALGFLFTEGIIQGIDQVAEVEQITVEGDYLHQNIVQVALAPDIHVDIARLERNFYTSSSCGICGKASIEAVAQELPPDFPRLPFQLSAKLIHSLPQSLREVQSVFEQTGGIHAAAVFTLDGQLQWVREDVGRHNALDKLIGAALIEDALPLTESILLLSGRCSFELVQKSLMAGIPALAAVGAPSSLAIQLARENGMCVLGFVRDNRFNIYCGKDRVLLNDGRSGPW